MPTKKQELGEFGERKVVQNCSCPRCKRKHTLRQLRQNFKCADVICDFCGYLAQVKAISVKDIGTLPKQVLGAAWGVQKERLDAGI
jgi:Zn ribbon nucleic-acid-binding protein